MRYVLLVFVLLAFSVFADRHEYNETGTDHDCMAYGWLEITNATWPAQIVYDGPACPICMERRTAYCKFYMELLDILYG